MIILAIKSKRKSTFLVSSDVRYISDQKSSIPYLFIFVYKMMATIVLLLLLNICCLCKADSIPSSSEKVCIEDTHIKIALMGDSLMNQAYFNFNLVDQIINELKNINSRPSYNISFQCFASGGSAIINIRDNQLWPTIRYQPNGTILFWDTDCSGVDETKMTPEEVDSLRSAFRTNVEVVTQTVMNHTGSVMALAGPGVLGDDQVVKMAK